MFAPLLAAIAANEDGFGPRLRNGKHLFAIRKLGSTGLRVPIFEYGPPNRLSLRRLAWLARQDARAVPEVNMLMRLNAGNVARLNLARLRVCLTAHINAFGFYRCRWRLQVRAVHGRGHSARGPAGLPSNGWHWCAERWSNGLSCCTPGKIR